MQAEVESLGQPCGKDGEAKGAKTTGQGGHLQGNGSVCGPWGHELSIVGNDQLSDPADGY